MPAGFGWFSLVLWEPLSCDFIVAARSARFAFPEARVGIMTLQGGVVQLAERIGRTKAIEAVMLSEPLPAEQLQAWNVVNRVVEDRALALAGGRRPVAAGILVRQLRNPTLSVTSADQH